MYTQDIPTDLQHLSKTRHHIFKRPFSFVFNLQLRSLDMFPFIPGPRVLFAISENCRSNDAYVHAAWDDEIRLQNDGLALNVSQIDTPADLAQV